MSTGPTPCHQESHAVRLERADRGLRRVLLWRELALVAGLHCDALEAAAKAARRLERALSPTELAEVGQTAGELRRVVAELRGLG